MHFNKAEVIVCSFNERFAQQVHPEFELPHYAFWIYSESVVTAFTVADFHRGQTQDIIKIYVIYNKCIKFFRVPGKS